MKKNHMEHFKKQILNLQQLKIKQYQNQKQQSYQTFNKKPNKYIKTLLDKIKVLIQEYPQKIMKIFQQHYKNQNQMVKNMVHIHYYQQTKMKFNQLIKEELEKLKLQMRLRQPDYQILHHQHQYKHKHKPNENVLPQ